MKTATCILVLLAVAGVANAQYATVLEAVQKMPQLSQVAKHIGAAGSVTKLVSDPKWVGTVFIPTDAALQRIATLVGGGPDMDLFAMLGGDEKAMQGMLSTDILDGVALDSASLKEGQTLKAMNGEVLSVSFKSPLKVEAAGKTIFVNGAPVDTADVPAGKAVLYLMGAPVLSKEYQSQLDQLTASSSAPAPGPVPATKSGKPAAVALPATTKVAANTTATAAATPAAAATKPATSASPAPVAASPSPKVSSAGSASLAAALLAAPALMAMLL